MQESHYLDPMLDESNFVDVGAEAAQAAHQVSAMAPVAAATGLGIMADKEYRQDHRRARSSRNRRRRDSLHSYSPDRRTDRMGGIRNPI